MLIEWYKKFLKKEDLKELKSLSYILDVAGIVRKPVNPQTTNMQTKPVAKVDVSKTISKW